LDRCRRRGSGTSGGIHCFRFRCSNFGPGGRDRQGNWADAGRARCPDRCELDLNLGQGYVGPRESIHLRRTAGECAADAPIQSDRFIRAQAICVGLLEMP
jgi:hypothetical protein